MKQLPFRIGQSHDIHKLKHSLLGQDKLILGLESIDAKFTIIAHSDGDVLIHAIAEAILGALGLKDLGTHFSDVDQKNFGISGLSILQYCDNLLKKLKYEIINIDSLIILDNFKLANYLEIFAKNITNAFSNLDVSQINIKATTSENLANNYIQAEAVVLLQKK